MRVIRTSTNQADWISIIETGYNLEENDSQWLRRVLDQAAPLLGRDTNPLGWTFHCTPTTFKLGSFSEGTPKALTYLARMSHTLATEKSLDLTYRTGTVIATASELVFPRLPDMHKMFKNLLKSRMRDLLVINCQSGVGSGASIGVLLKETSKATDQEKRRWPQIAAHLGAAMRLRNIAAALSLENSTIEAVLESDGDVYDARGPAKDRDARATLRAIVRRIEHSRTREGREDMDEALANWVCLVSGRWSLVDYFDSDQRRFIVAIKDDPAYPDPRGLTPRERQVAEYAGLGRSSKEIAYTLGLSESAITNCTARVQDKLGMASRTELVSFFAPNGFRRKLAEKSISDERFLIASSSLINTKDFENLSEAEREITVLMIAGSTNADIAEKRGVSEYTITNQVQSIFRKLCVRSRGELVVRLQKPGK